MATNTRTGLHFCSVCELALHSDAELAIHEFSKKHCDNLIRVSRKQPVKTKTSKPHSMAPPPKKKKVEAPPVEQPPVNIALYGYFQPQNLVDQQPKEFNTEYDPYLQKFAENPEKQISTAVDQLIMPTTNVTSFSTSKKKKKRACQICGVVNMNIPEYEAHMRSSLHIAKLKYSGMGVNAHFVKAGADLHTTDALKKSEAGESATGSLGSVPISPSDLLCEPCGLLLNSTSQFQSHIKSAAHQATVLKKEKKTAKLPNALFCYSCQLSLTNLAQFNDHKIGKRHKKKCHMLMKEGISIPLEERWQDYNWARANLKFPPVYPAGYEEEMVEKAEAAVPQKKESLPAAPTDVEGFVAAAAKTAENSTFKCSVCELIFKMQEQFECHLNSEEHALKILELKKAGGSVKSILTKIMEDRLICRPNLYRRKCCGVCAVMSSNEKEFDQHLTSLVHKYAVKDYEKKRLIEISSNPVKNEEANTFSCKVCDNSHATLSAFYIHLHTNDHRTKTTKYKIILARKNRFGWLGPQNPGVRTKIRGIATDLATGSTGTIECLEHLEPDIDAKKNVKLGTSPKKIKKKLPRIIPARKLPGMVFRKVKIPPPCETNVVPPPAPSSAEIPPLVPPSFRLPTKGWIPRPMFVHPRKMYNPGGRYEEKYNEAGYTYERNHEQGYSRGYNGGYNSGYSRQQDLPYWAAYGEGMAPPPPPPPPPPRYPTQYPQPRSHRPWGPARPPMGWNRFLQRHL